MPQHEQMRASGWPGPGPADPRAIRHLGRPHGERRLGESFYYKMPVATLIGQRLEPTLALASVTILFAILVSVPLGVVAAWASGAGFDAR